MAKTGERVGELRQVADGLFEVLWRPAGLLDGRYQQQAFAPAFAATDTGRWLDARRDDYALLTEPGGQAAYLLVRDPAVVRLLLIKLA